MSYINLLILSVILVGCGLDNHSNTGKEKKEVIIEHYNITVSSDLSNRLNQKLYPKAVSDAEIVNIIGMNIYPKILGHKRAMNQLDQFRVDFINKKQISAYRVNTKNLEIDFSRFKLQAERIQYLRDSFQGDERRFESEFLKAQDKAIKNPFGSDIWTYMQQGVDGFIVNNEQHLTKGSLFDYKNTYKNVLIVLTDGYIEAGILDEDYDLSGKKINAFRKEFLASGDKDIQTFYKKNPKYRIHKLANPLLKNLEVLVLELYDRTETNTGASIHPTDLEIMKLIWSDWLKCSGVKRLELYPKFSNKAEAEKVIFKFLGV